MKLKIHLFIFIHALISLLVMLVYSKYTPLSIDVILIHSIAICSIYITVLFCIPHKFIVLFLSALSTLLLLFYISNFVAIHYWNDVITWSFLIDNASVFARELQKFPIYVFAILLILIISIVKIYNKLLPFQTDFRQHFGILPLIPILVGTFYYSIYAMQDNMSETLQGEPLFEFFNTNIRYSTTNNHTIISTLTKTDKAIPLQKTKNKKQPNIILIHGDALRADRLSAYGNLRKTSPFIDSLIYTGGGVKIPNSMSNCSETICGVASVTTSSFSYKGEVKNIFDILTKNGFVTNFIGTGDLYHGGLDQFLNPVVHNLFRADLNSEYYKHDDRFVIDTLSLYPKAPEQPQLFYLRMMSSHQLGAHRQKYKRYQPTPNSLFSMGFFGGDTLKAQINAHDNFASDFDGYVKSIFSIMGSKGYLDNAVVVIFGDHGDAMGEHGYQGHFNSIYQEEVHVPIVIWSSNNIDIGVKTNSFATLMDIPATLLYYLNITIPKNFLGKPLQIEINNKVAYLDSKRKVAGVLYQEDKQLYKLFVSKKEMRALRLFELNADPDELTDRRKQNKKITTKLMNLHKKFRNVELSSQMSE